MNLHKGLVGGRSGNDCLGGMWFCVMDHLKLNQGAIIPTHSYIKEEKMHALASPLEIKAFGYLTCI